MFYCFDDSYSPWGQEMSRFVNSDFIKQNQIEYRARGDMIISSFIEQRSGEEIKKVLEHGELHAKERYTT